MGVGDDVAGAVPDEAGAGLRAALLAALARRGRAGRGSGAAPCAKTWTTDGLARSNSATVAVSDWARSPRAVTARGVSAA